MLDTTRGGAGERPKTLFSRAYWFSVKNWTRVPLHPALLPLQILRAEFHN